MFNDDFFNIQVKGSQEERPYTPIVLPRPAAAGPTTARVFEVVIKAYPYPTALSPVLFASKVGSLLHLRVGAYPSGVNLPRGVRYLNMVAGGTGITPMLQVLLGLLEDKQRGVGVGMPKVKLLFANRSKEDVIMLHELSDLTLQHKEISIHHALSDEKQEMMMDTSWAPHQTASAGRVDVKLLDSFLSVPAPNCMNLICGPPSFHEAVMAALTEIGHRTGACHEFK